MNLDFSKLNGLIPVIVQDAHTRQVLMLGFMNEEAYQKTLEEKVVTFYSRSKERLWTKGETSGNKLLVEEIQPDCDQDTLLVKVRPTGPVCHTGKDTCFDEGNPEHRGFLDTLESVIAARKKELPEDSYTTALFRGGVNKISQKVGEEAVEVVIASKENDRDAFVGEAADLVYHLVVLLQEKDASLEEVERVLYNRHLKR